ncbi:MAG: flagellar motor protein MotB [Defluviitaleaceae bacterium]|nr:flagellar motor protein MotB [Defluviitaleaceae bacterium]
MAKAKKQEEPKAGSPAWMTSFSDMMSLLLCFFVLLFAMSETEISEDALAAILAAFGNPHFHPQIAVVQPENNPGLGQMFNAGMMNMPSIPSGMQQGEGTAQGQVAQTTPAEVQMAMQAMVSDFITYFTESPNPLADQVDVALIDDTIVLSFTDNMLFATGSDILNPLTIEILDYVGSVLLDYPEFMIGVYGHTDNVPISTPIFRDNYWLGFGRAMSVRNHFVNNHGIDHMRVRPNSYGEYRPIAPNDTEEGRALNRRVEIIISAPN